jgi:hypothetical protein
MLFIEIRISHNLPPMPQVDFRQIFPASSQDNHLAREDIESSLPPTENAERIGTTDGLSRSQWTNIAFVACASIGSLVCALYLFNGDELWRDAAAWPRELFYHRPATPARQVATPTLNGEQPNQAASGNTSVNDSGDPFARSAPFLNFNTLPAILSPRANKGASASNSAAPAPDTLLNRLNIPPGGDTFSQILNQGAVDLARTSNLAANANGGATAAVQTSHSQVRSRATAWVRSATRQAKSTRSASRVRSPVRSANRFKPHAPNLAERQRLKMATQQAVSGVKPAVKTTSAAAQRASQIPNVLHGVPSTSVGIQAGSIRGGLGMPFSAPAMSQGVRGR